MKTMSEILTFFRGGGRANTLNMSNLREGFSSLKPPWGSISLASSAVTATDTGAGVFSKLEGVTQLNNSGYLTSMPADNRIEYTGDSTRHFHIAVSASFFKSGGGAQAIELGIAVNGSVLTETIVSRTVSNDNNIGSTAIHGDVMLSNGDYIELFIANEDAGTINITLDKMYMFMVGMMV